jgi:L-2,4-diaminobutyric acid acetyltransferase
MIYGSTVIYDADALRRQAATAPLATIRRPHGTDGSRIWSLIEATPALDGNSLYCNLLQATHFAATCAIAEMDGRPVGWLSAYIPPDHPDTLFVWQVCVGSAARGQGLGRRLIADVLARPVCGGVTTLQCTITEDNDPSWALFGGVARRLDAQMRQVEHFKRDEHFNGQHDSEYAVSIGPFGPDQVAKLSSG